MQVDARNKSCPQPVILATKALDQLAAQGQADQELEVLANEMVAVENLKRLAASRGRAVEVVEGAGEWSVRIAGGEAPAEDSASAGEGASAFEAVCDLPATQSSPLATVAHGCEILTCGTCLDFHGLKDKLAVGGITNLYAISQILLSGGVVSL